jgi:hypothetical protein
MTCSGKAKIDLVKLCYVIADNLGILSLFVASTTGFCYERAKFIMPMYNKDTTVSQDYTLISTLDKVVLSHYLHGFTFLDTIFLPPMELARYTFFLFLG